MERAERRDFRKPDEVRQFPMGRLDLINVGGVQPLVKTKSCEAPHFQYHVSGVLRIRIDDGTEFDCRPGDVSLGDARAR